MSFNIESLKKKAETRIFSELKKAEGKKINAEKLISENNSTKLYELGGVITIEYDIFLSHKTEDATVILGVLETLKEMGYTVYVDWIEDTQLDRTRVNKETSETLRNRMNQCKSLLFVTTDNFSESKWMPWELGYMDGKKGLAAILPVFIDEKSASHKYEGQEYLGIYPYCIKANVKGSTTEKLWIFNAPKEYVTFNEWLDGSEPFIH